MRITNIFLLLPLWMLNWATNTTLSESAVLREVEKIPDDGTLKYCNIEELILAIVYNVNILITDLRCKDCLKDNSEQPIYDYPGDGIGDKYNVCKPKYLSKLWEIYQQLHPDRSR